MNNAKFIVFEGCEGSGKTTQINNLSNWLQSQKIQTWVTREPGGCTDDLKVLRELALSNKVEPNTELLLMLADRSHHVKQIKQMLSNNIWVLCDRFTWSTFAYQGCGNGFDFYLLDHLNTLATNGLKPDWTILLDIDPKLGLERKAMQKQQNKIESRGLDYHNRVREGYLKLFERAILDQDTKCLLLYHLNKNTQELYTVDSLLNSIVESFPF